MNDDDGKFYHELIILYAPRPGRAPFCVPISKRVTCPKCAKDGVTAYFQNDRHGVFFECCGLSLNAKDNLPVLDLAAALYHNFHAEMRKAGRPVTMFDGTRLFNSSHMPQVAQELRSHYIERRIVECLKQHGGSMLQPDLHEALAVTKEQVRDAVKRLLKKGTVSTEPVTVPKVGKRILVRLLIPNV